MDEALASIGGLSVEERPAALALLTQQARDAIGMEEENVAYAVLAVCGDASIPLNGTADTAVETLTPILSCTSLEADQARKAPERAFMTAVDAREHEGELAGPNRVDHDKKGFKIHFIADRNCLPYTPPERRPQRPAGGTP
ncbi:hypothetical protein ACWCOT_02250 [Nonomuraea bangladeshensis]